jgi:hypothetical protein
MRALCTDRDKRYPSVGEFLNALNQLEFGTRQAQAEPSAAPSSALLRPSEPDSEDTGNVTQLEGTQPQPQPAAALLTDPSPPKARSWLAMTLLAATGMGLWWFATQSHEPSMPASVSARVAELGQAPGTEPAVTAASAAASPAISPAEVTPQASTLGQGSAQRAPARSRPPEALPPPKPLPSADPDRQRPSVLGRPMAPNPYE